MTKATKICLIIAAALVTLGLLVSVGALFMIKFDFSSLNTAKLETSTHEISEDFDNITIETDTSDIILLPSTDDKCKVVCYEYQKENHSVSVVDGTLKVIREDTREWYDHIGIFSFGSSSIKIYLPESKYASISIKADTSDINIPNDFRFGSIEAVLSTGDVKCYASASQSLKIKTSTGDITVENVKVGALGLTTSTGDIIASGVKCDGDVELKVTTGKTYLTNLTCKNLTSQGDTGDINLKGVISSEKLNISRSTGDVTFDGCDASTLLIVTDTGDVTGRLLSGKLFVYKTDTGDVDLPKSTNGGGVCDITTDTGDIRINIGG